MKIGDLEIQSKLALAPMAGVTDMAFRQICSELGAGLTYTELISSKALCYQDQKTRGLLHLFPGEHPCAVQLFGSDPDCMARAAQLALRYSGSGLPFMLSMETPCFLSFPSNRSACPQSRQRREISLTKTASIMWRWASPAISRIPGRFRERPLPISAISATIL